MSKRKFASECGLSAATAKRRTRAVPAAAAAVAAPVEPQPSHSAGIPAASAAELVRGSARAVSVGSPDDVHAFCGYARRACTRWRAAAL